MVTILEWRSFQEFLPEQFCHVLTEITIFYFSFEKFNKKSSVIKYSIIKISWLKLKEKMDCRSEQSSVH